MTTALAPEAALPLGLAMVFAAGLIRGFTGFGLSIAAVPLLSLILPPAQAVPIVLLLQLLVSLSGLSASAKIADWRAIRMLALGAVIATPLGTWGLARLPAAPVRIAIALIVLAAVFVLARGFRFKMTGSNRLILPFGLLSGLFNGIAGMPGPPVIAYFLMTPRANATARASMIVFFLATSVFALVPLACFGLIGLHTLAAAAIGFPVVLAGSWLGGRIFHASPDAHYRTVALSLLVGAALLAAIRAFQSV